jgi:hypothetical protein
VDQAEESACKRSQASAVAAFDFWPGEEIEKPWVEFCVLCYGGTWRLGTGWGERNRASVMTKMRGEIAHDAEVSVQIAGDRSFNAPATFVEIRVRCVEIGTKVKVVVVGFNG